MIRGSRKEMLKDFDYYITEDGKVYALDDFELSTRVGRDGYITVGLFRDRKSHTRYVHRLMAEAFLPKKDGLNELNHLDGNKQNNTLSNFEWASHSGNIKHAYCLGLIDKSKISRKVIDTLTGYVYQSAKEAAVSANINYATLKNYLNGGRSNKTTLKYLD